MTSTEPMTKKIGQETQVKKKPLFGTDIDIDPRTGKQFELRASGLFIPLPGEFKAEPPPPETEAIGIAEKGLFVPRSTQTHFQKDFSKTVKMDPLFGERIRTRESSINAAHAAFTVNPFSQLRLKRKKSS